MYRIITVLVSWSFFGMHSKPKPKKKRMGGNVLKKAQRMSSSGLIQNRCLDVQLILMEPQLSVPFNSDGIITKPNEITG